MPVVRVKMVIMVKLVLEALEEQLEIQVMQVTLADAVAAAVVVLVV